MAQKVKQNILRCASTLCFRVGVFAVLCMLVFSACASTQHIKSKKKRYSHTILGALDTVIQFTAYADTKAEFDRYSEYTEKRFMELSKLFDKYYSYDKITNLYSINSNAGIYPVKVSDELYNMLEESVYAYTLTDGYLDISLGSVYGAWRDFIAELDTQPTPPTPEQLAQLREYGGISNIELNKEERTVFVKLKGMEIDVGATAKGYAVELISNELREMGCNEFVINAGGNVSAGEYPYDENKDKWTIAVKNPDQTAQSPHLMKLNIENMSAVTSGNYERYRTYNGVNYHHIIDPKTLMPSNHFSAVTVIAESSAEADIYSTSIFSMPYDKGLALATEKDLAVLWVMPDGKLEYTDKFESFISE